jgi:hypothetical protein
VIFVPSPSRFSANNRGSDQDDSPLHSPDHPPKIYKQHCSERVTEFAMTYMNESRQASVAYTGCRGGSHTSEQTLGSR